jgi:alpha-mannosidase
MRYRWSLAAMSIFAVVLGLGPFHSEDAGAPKPVLYVVATSHLDSQWNWTVQDSIREFVPATFFQNFERFKKYPDYTFTYEGAIHYMWFKEYYPEAWPTLQKYVAEGRWRIAGSWIDAVDTNIPAPESLMRQALYAKRFFRQEFGKASEDVFLPDSFGFGYALPSVAVHSGLNAFSTQKLTWGSSYGIPFPVGRWKGVDGSEVVAALNPGDYVTKLRSDISIDPNWSKDLTSVSNGRKVGFRYFGTGDVGGAPDEQSVEWLEKSIANKNGNVEIRNTSADQLARDLMPTQRAALPVYRGELTMKTHGVGCYTSQAAMKRFNRENELLADSSERAAVAAQWLAGLPYPGGRLRDAWVRFLWHQFHDDLTGTCIPQAYLFSWNDELVSANQFAGVLTNSVAAVANMLDTEGATIPIIVYNPLAMSRQDVVEATIEFAGPAPAYIRVVDDSNQVDVPAQILERHGTTARIIFLAEMPSVGFKVFHIRPSPRAPGVNPSLRATRSDSTSSLESKRYKVEIDANGDIAHIFDKNAGKELLSAPIRLEMRDDPSPDKPAWRILWDTVNAPVREYPAAPVVRIVESGPVRSVIEITRKAGGSTFVQRVMLTEGGDRVDVENWVDWKSTNTLLKVAFPFAASNPKATYDLGLGSIERGNNTPDHYEVPAQKWADLTDANGTFGAAVLNDNKYGWDKPSDHVIRLSLIHTPRPRAYPYQGSNDLGHHHFVYAIAGHRGDWRDGRVPAQAAALNQPLVAFQTTNHAGPLGRSFSMLSLDSSYGQVAVRALKKAEDSDEIVVRLQEQYGRAARVRIKLAGKVAAAYELNAAEERLGPFALSAGEVVVELKPYQPRTLALHLQPSPLAAPPPSSVSLTLPFNLDGFSTDANRADGDFDGRKQTMAAEQVPRELQLDGISFHLGSGAPGTLNSLVPAGQRLALPPGNNNRLYILASAVGGDSQTTFSIAGQAGESSEPLTINEWQGPIGQWDSRLRDPNLMRARYVPQFKGQSWASEEIQSGMIVETDLGTGAVRGINDIHRGFVKRAEIALVGTHRHAPDGDQPYVPTYVFMYSIDLVAGAREVRLPNDERIRILAMSVARAPQVLQSAVALFASDLSEPLDGSPRRH